MNYSYQVGRGEGGVSGFEPNIFFNLSNSNGANVWLCVSV